MTLSQTEAADALATIEATAARTKQLSGYRKASPFLILWGAIWACGFSVDDLAPQIARISWLALDLLGFLGTFGLIVMGRHRMRERISNGFAWRALAITMISLMFGFATFMLLRPRDAMAGMAFAGLLTGTIYAMIGIFVGSRWLITGLGLLALTFLGYFALSAHYGLWMAWICGGGLILAGLWLRRV